VADDLYKREQLWNAAYETYYYVYFDELLCDTLVSCWSKIDEWTRVALAVTSTIASWALWQQHHWREIWAIIAAIGALIAILHLTLGVTHRLKDLNECKNRLLRLRLEMQTFRMRMKIDPDFSTSNFESELLEFRKRHFDDCPKTTDLLATNKLKNRVQDFLNTQIT